MFSNVLVLVDTGISSNDCLVPQEIDLKICQEKGSIKLGRGSPLYPVDVKIFVRKNGKEIISRHHAEVVYNAKSDQFILSELSALNGLFVNDISIKSHVLKHEDVIQFGGLFNSTPGYLIDKTDISIKYQYLRQQIICTKKRPRADDTRPQVSIKSEFSTSATKKARPILDTVKATKLNIDSIPTLHTATVVVGKSITNGHSNNTPNNGLKHDHKASDSTTRKSQSSSFTSSSNTPSTTLTPLESSFCSIDNSTLKASLSCILCNDILLDAVILKCSHGYCRVCIESHIRNFESQCPNCNDAPVRKIESGNKTGYSHLYSRSDHLESLVWTLLTASSTTVNEDFKRREKAARATLVKLGIDPEADFSTYSPPPHDNTNKHAKKDHTNGHKNSNNKSRGGSASSGSGSDTTTTSSDGDGRGSRERNGSKSNNTTPHKNNQNDTQNNNFGSRFTTTPTNNNHHNNYNTNATTIAPFSTIKSTTTPVVVNHFRTAFAAQQSSGGNGGLKSSLKKVKPLCEYCGQDNHRTKDCPHDNNTKESGSEDDSFAAEEEGSENSANFSSEGEED